MGKSALSIRMAAVKVYLRSSDRSFIYGEVSRAIIPLTLEMQQILLLSKMKLLLRKSVRYSFTLVAL